MNKEKIEKLKYERYEELSKEELKDFECLISKYSKSLLAYNLIMEKQENKKQKELIDKAVLELANIDGNLSNSQLSDRICNLIDMLKG